MCEGVGFFLQEAVAFLCSLQPRLHLGQGPGKQKAGQLKTRKNIGCSSKYAYILEGKTCNMSFPDMLHSRGQAVEPTQKEAQIADREDLGAL